MSFEEANKKEHPVETQWHYDKLTQYGFEPVTKTAVGFVRSYEYQKNGYKITGHTGVHADYWNDLQTKDTGYWSDLLPHLERLQQLGKI